VTARDAPRERTAAAATVSGVGRSTEGLRRRPARPLIVVNRITAVRCGAVRCGAARLRSIRSRRPAA